MYQKHWRKCTQKRKLKNVEFKFWYYMNFKYNYIFVYPLAKKPK